MSPNLNQLADRTDRGRDSNSFLRDWITSSRLLRSADVLALLASRTELSVGVPKGRAWSIPVLTVVCVEGGSSGRWERPEAGAN
jgi:hypothetical protein